jgi:hypothetical protein
MNYPGLKYQTKNDSITCNMSCEYCSHIISIPQVYNQSNSIISYGWKCTRCGNNCSTSVGGQKRGSSGRSVAVGGVCCLHCSII